MYLLLVTGTSYCFTLKALMCFTIVASPWYGKESVVTTCIIITLCVDSWTVQGINFILIYWSNSLYMYLLLCAHNYRSWTGQQERQCSECLMRLRMLCTSPSPPNCLKLIGSAQNGPVTSYTSGCCTTSIHSVYHMYYTVLHDMYGLKLSSEL